MKIKKRQPTKGKDIFGMFPDLPKNTDKILRELNEALDSIFSNNLIYLEN